MYHVSCIIESSGDHRAGRRQQARSTTCCTFKLLLNFQAVTMAKNDKSDLSTFRSACLELTRLLAKEGQHFSLEIKIGDQFSFSAQSKGIRRQPALGSSDGGIWKKKKKSASAMERDRRRKIAFLKRKGVPLSPATSLVSTSLVTSTATSDAASRQTEKLASHTAQGKGRSTGMFNNSGGAHDYMGENSPSEAIREGELMSHSPRYLAVRKGYIETARRLDRIKVLSRQIEENMRDVIDVKKEFK